MSTWFLAEDAERNIFISHTDGTIIPDPIHVGDLVEQEEWKVVTIFSPETSAVLNAVYSIGYALHSDGILEALGEIVDLAVETGRASPTSL